MKIKIGLLSVIWLGMLTAKAQAAEVHINVNIGAPPPIIVRSAPTMVYLAEPAVYVAVGIPYDLYFVGGRYYYFRGNNWFWAPGYGGPWNYVVHSSLPPGLRKFKPARLHDFRDREYRVYRVSSRDYRYNDRYFVADYGRPGKSHGNGRGRGHNKH
jgi:hypothetical protein